MGFFCAYQSRGRGRRIKQKINETALIFGGKPDDLGFFNRPVRSLLGGGNYKITNASALHFGGVFHKGKHLRSNRVLLKKMRECKACLALG